MSGTLKEMIDSAHVFAEMIKLHYDSFKEAGFNEEQSLSLTRELIRALVISKGNSQQED